MGFISLSYAQSNRELLFIAKVSKEEVPKTINKAIKGDFPNLIVTDIIAVPFDGYAPSNITPVEGYDDYTVMFKGKTSKIMATYNKEGKLISTVDHFKDKMAPAVVRNAIANVYPDWVILTGYKKFTSFTKDGSLKGEKFKITIENGDKKRKVFADKAGNINKGNVKF